MIEHLFQLVDVEFLCAQQVQQDSGIEITTASPHGYASSGRKPHGGVDRYSVTDGAQAGPISEVGKYGSFGKMRTEMVNQRFVGESVKTIASNSCFEVALGDGKMRATSGMV